MFERFSDEARQVVVLAHEEARALRHSYIGTEHILIGLLREEEQRPADERPLHALGVTLAETRDRVTRVVGAGEEEVSGQIPFTPRAKKVLELALREARSLDHDVIGPEHILLGLVRENEGVGARILLDFDADSLKVRNAVIRILSGMPPRPVARVTRGRSVRVPMDDAWLDGVADVLPILAREIRQALAREPDLGDLLLTIACARRTPAGQALSELGIDLDALWGTLERIRQERSDEGEELDRKLGELRDQRRRALQNEQFQEAARLRDEERHLTEEYRSQSHEDVLREVRGRLGLPRPEE